MRGLSFKPKQQYFKAVKKKEWQSRIWIKLTFEHTKKKKSKYVKINIQIKIKINIKEQVTVATKAIAGLFYFIFLLKKIYDLAKAWQIWETFLF